MAKTDFDVIKVPLNGSNLIEASAGTGKTYSIAILVIRLVIEKRIELRQILMVTFTNAAVAELEVRIRRFIREAYAYTSDGCKIDDTIRTIVDQGVQQLGKEEVLTLLMNARRQLDETSIFTIHSFCQKTLNEFAFETGQAFNVEVVEDEVVLINEVVSDYWRKHITTLNSDLLTFLLKNGLSKNGMASVVSKAKRGKWFIYEGDVDIESEKAELEKLKILLLSAQRDYNDLYRETINGFSKLLETTKVPKYIAENIRDRDKIRGQLNKPVALKLFPELSSASNVLNEVENALGAVAQDCINYLYGEAISFCDAAIQTKKQEQSLFSFDDLINKLHQAVSSESLQAAVRKQYKAVFIDEFQDTDQKQYDIFDAFFNRHAILFYIGDPKQSIYGFKGTDLDTYLEAATKVSNPPYTMSKNFRSTAAYIDALNKLFTSIDNPFYDERIGYETVGAGFSIPEITAGNRVVDPLSLYQCDNNTQVVEQTTNLVKELLLGNYQIDGRKIKPSDIGILVRANDKGPEIKHCLNKANIPAITIDDSHVMESEQSTLLLYLLKAMFKPSVNTINRVLLTCLTNKTKDDLLKLDMEADLEFFRSLNETWTTKGVFSAINTFMNRYNTLENIHASMPDDAERIITNLLQINEILHNKENQSKSSPKELIHWLELAVTGAETGGEYIQRLENDEDAVKIVTIHKSKGLAYNIVIAPYLDLKSKYNNKWGFIEYKDPQRNQYCFSAAVTDDALGLYSLQAERENRRLIYVALTRAVYMGVIIHNVSGAKPDIGIKAFLDGAISKGLFAFKENLASDSWRYNDQKETIDKTPRCFPDLPIDGKWSRYSFSMLSKYEPHEKPEPVELTGNYDRFVFEGFPMGALAGNFMHYLFENTDFTSNDFSAAITKALNRYKSLFHPDIHDLEEMLSEMLSHVVNTVIPAETPFKLTQVNEADKLPEMGFNFQMSPFKSAKLHSLIPSLNLERGGDIQGIMNGFIDLLFEHNGRFYILDWKSNYLGNALEHYTPDKLEVAMVGSNYHLQYSIYTVAVKLYLQNCIPNFDYNTHFGGIIYVFVRGCRKEGDTGIYFTKPPKSLVDALEELLVQENVVM